MSAKILIVDDEPAIRGLLYEFLSSSGYVAETARDGVDALEKLSKAEYDLVMSDINMPRMKGFELLKAVREKYPKTKRVLITAYNVDDYLSLAFQHDVGNIIPKSTPFQLENVLHVVEGLINEDFFGIEKHLDHGTGVVNRKVNNTERIELVTAEITGGIGDSQTASRLKLVVTEMLTNAVFYGARQEDPEQKQEWDVDFTLKEEESVEIQWGRDRDKLAVLVADPFGRLKKSDVLYWLSRQATKDSSGLPVGVSDSHGRGFFIARAYVDQLIVNIHTGKRTEIIALLYNDPKFKGYKPLSINEI